MSDLPSTKACRCVPQRTASPPRSWQPRSRHCRRWRYSTRRAPSVGSFRWQEARVAPSVGPSSRTRLGGLRRNLPHGFSSATVSRSGSENERRRLGGERVAILATGFGCSTSCSGSNLLINRACSVKTQLRNIVYALESERRVTRVSALFGDGVDRPVESWIYWRVSWKHVTKGLPLFVGQIDACAGR